MNPQQVATVLLLVAAAEGRAVDEAQVALWSATLAVHNITEEEFRKAVVLHYAESTYPIRPGHVWQRVQPWRQVSAIDEALAETEKHQRHALMFEEAQISGDWSAFDAAYPGERREWVRRELTWWQERGGRTPEQVLTQATELGLLPREVES